MEREDLQLHNVGDIDKSPSENEKKLKKRVKGGKKKKKEEKDRRYISRYMMDT